MNPFDLIDFPVDVPFATAEDNDADIIFFVAIRTSGQKKVEITSLKVSIDAYTLTVKRLDEPTDKDEAKCYEKSLPAPSEQSFYVEVKYVDKDGNPIFTPQDGKKCRLYFERIGGGGGE
ncbi:MAG: hypothetical protein AAFW00_02675 [Bacteroidota bacterium]